MRHAQTSLWQKAWPAATNGGSPDTPRRQPRRAAAAPTRPGGVHHRAGQPCPVCGDTVREVSYAKYSVNYCPTCQTNGKVLADNTTSKFLK